MNNRFKSVWDAIEDAPEQAAEMRMRAEALRKLQEFIRSHELTQSAAAERLGVSQPRVSDPMRGRIQLFSLDMLVAMLGRLGVRVSLHFEEAAGA